MHPGFGTGQLKGDSARLAVAAAIEAGYTTIDTGAIYGNETEVGQAIAKSGRRSELLVITKGAHDPEEHGYKEIRTSFTASLGRLALEYVDYYLIHWPANPEARQQTWKGMLAIRDAGGAKAIGVSNYAVHHLAELPTGEDGPVVNQIEFHPYVYAAQQDILEYCQEQGIALMGYATFANGQADADPVVTVIARRHQKTPRQVLTRWSLQHGVLPLVRSGNSSHITENFAVDDFTLSPDEMRALNSLRGVREFRDPHSMA